MATEAVLVRRIMRELAARYPSAWQFKVVGNPYQMIGVPDILLCVSGRFVGLEVKNPWPGETPEAARARTTPVQRSQIAKIVAAGGTAAVVVSVEEALDAVAGAL